jgi:cytochrome c oxidase subunit 4
MAEETTIGRKQPKYFLIWLYLLILTVAEVTVAFVSHLPETILILILLFLAVWKAALVAMYFMHLKFEPPRLVVMILLAIPLALLLTIAVVIADV